MAAVTGQPADRCDFRHGQGRHCKKTLPARLVKTGTKGGEKASEVEEGAEKKPPSGCRDPAVDELAGRRRTIPVVCTRHGCVILHSP